MLSTARLLLAVSLLGELSVAAGLRESFSERLKLRRLAAPTGLAGEESALASFSFSFALNRTSPADAQHTDLFPASVRELMQTHRASSISLSMTSGSWDEDLWGAAFTPPGVTMQAVVPAARQEEAWAGLTTGTAGVSCPTLALLGYGATSTPHLSHPLAPARRGNVFLSASDPHQVVCLGHLHAATQLLPCKTSRGLAADILGRELELLKARFLSVRLHATATEDLDGLWSYGMELQVAAVLNRAGTHEFRPGSDFGQSFLAEPATAQLPPCCLCALPGAGQSHLVLGDRAFDLSDTAGTTADATSTNSVELRDSLRSFWQTQPSPAGVPVGLRGYIAGSSYVLSSFVYELSNNLSEPVLARLWHTVPSIVELQYSTLGARSLNDDSDVSLRVLGRPPNSDPARPTGPIDIELLLMLPPRSTVMVSMRFGRRFMDSAGYPSDSARGLDCSAPSLSYWTAAALSEGGVPEPLAGLAALERLGGVRPSAVVYGGAGMVVQIAWPDFSMPYNVICVSCSLPMLVFGSIVSGATRPRGGPPEEPRPLVAFILWWLRLFDKLFGE